MMVRCLLSLCLSLGLLNCASDPYRMPGAAYAADDMTFDKPMPDRRYHKPWEFYYKHCSESGHHSHYSKTSYDCSGPYY